MATSRAALVQAGVTWLLNFSPNGDQGGRFTQCLETGYIGVGKEVSRRIISANQSGSPETIFASWDELVAFAGFALSWPGQNPIKELVSFECPQTLPAIALQEYGLPSYYIGLGIPFWKGDSYNLWRDGRQGQSQWSLGGSHCQGLTFEKSLKFTFWCYFQIGLNI